MSAIKLITINEYDTITDITTKVELLKETEYNNIQMNMGELAFNLRRRAIFKMWSRVEITRDDDSIGYYYVTSATSTLIDMLSETNPYYEHSIIFVEITEKLKLQLVSNLSFNDIAGSTVASYANLYEVIKRINLVSPLEIVGNVLETRVTTSEHSGSSSDASNIVPKMSERLETLLKNITDVPEFTFTGNNMFEAYNTVINLAGGAVEVKYNADGTTFLDIRLYDDTSIDTVTIDKFFDYNETKDTTNYATHAEVRTDNIVDKNAIFIAGADFYKWIGSTEKIIDEAKAIFECEKPIYKLNVVRILAYKTSNFSRTSTAQVVEQSQYDLLPVFSADNSKVAVNNAVVYTLNTSQIRNLHLQVKIGSTEIFSKAVWQQMFDKLNINANALEETVWQVEFIPLNKTNRFAVASKSFIENNVESYLNVNINDRINDSTRVITNAKSKISQACTKRITKKVEHKSYADVFELGARDTDTNFKIAVREFDYKFNVIYATYILAHELNYISDFVGVNSVNRFTDIEINGGLERREFYQDYVIFSTNKNLITEDDTILSRIGKEFASNVFLTQFTDNAASYSGQFVVKSEELVDVPVSFVNASVITGNGTLVFNCDFLNQTFTGNKIVKGDASFYLGLNVLQGVPYTDSFGRVKAIALNRGYKRQKHFTDLSDQERKNLPEVQDLIDLNDTALINFGSLATDNISKTEALGNRDNEWGQDLGFGTVTKENTHFYTIDDTMKHTTGYSMDIYVQEIKSGAIPVGALVSVVVEVKVIDINGATFIDSTTIPGAAIQEFFIYQNPITISKNYSGIIVDKIEVKFTIRQQRELIPLVTNFVYLRNFEYNYVEKVTVATDGLLVDKNQNETLSVAYQLNYTTMPVLTESGHEQENIILGDALTTNNELKILGFSKYSKMEMYVSETETYSKYDNTFKGTQVSLNSNNLKIEWQGDFEKVRILITDFNFAPFKSYALVGVDVSSKRYFLYGVNEVGTKFDRTIYIHFTHKHPKIRRLSQI